MLHGQYYPWQIVAREREKQTDREKVEQKSINKHISLWSIGRSLPFTIEQNTVFNYTRHLSKYLFEILNMHAE